jgi:hypothetical protein
MMTPNPGLSDLVHDLRTTLETISEGLVEGLPDRLLDAEPRLAEIVERLASTPLDAAPPPRDEIIAAQTALRRCQHLGTTIRSLGDLYAAAHAAGYDRMGRQPGGAHFGADAASVLQTRG